MLTNTLNWIRKIFRILIVVFFVYMVLAVFFQVLGRYFFNFKLDMASETATFAQIWMVLIAAGLALQKNMHVGVDVLINVLPKKIQKIVILITSLCSMAFLLIALKGSFALINVGFDSTSPASGMPMWIPYLSVPLGLMYIMIELVILTYKKLFDIKI